MRGLAPFRGQTPHTLMEIIKMTKLFRLISFLEGLSFVLLLFFAMPMKYAMADPRFVKMLGMPHGVLFLLYIILSVSVAIEREWGFKTSALVLLASVVPFGTFYADRKLF